MYIEIGIFTPMILWCKHCSDLILDHYLSTSSSFISWLAMQARHRITQNITHTKLLSPWWTLWTLPVTIFPFAFSRNLYVPYSHKSSNRWRIEISIKGTEPWLDGTSRFIENLKGKSVHVTTMRRQINNRIQLITSIIEYFKTRGVLGINCSLFWAFSVALIFLLWGLIG